MYHDVSTINPKKSPPKSVTNTQPRSSVKLILSSSFLSLFKEINCADTSAKVAGRDNDRTRAALKVSITPQSQAVS